MKELIKTLKENNQDYEFYPTSRELVQVVADDLIDKYLGTRDPKAISRNAHLNILDIGAGNGNFFSLLESFNPEYDDEYSQGLDYTKYAIEKSKILIEEMPADIFIVGTDFTEQTLIDKKMDVIFCNPPYSDYVYWTDKILSEANAPLVYLVIPARWATYKPLQVLLEKRKIDHKILHSFDFMESEHRKARAKVHLIRFCLGIQYRGHNKLNSDPFDIWFERSFKIDAQQTKTRIQPTLAQKRESIKELVQGRNLIETLEELYKEELDRLLENYKALENLDYAIFKELDVDVFAVKNSLKVKIEGLKNLYWEELFENLDSITAKLTKASRDKLLSKLTAHTQIDFTASNAYAIIIWALKNANIYFDDQLKAVYMWMSYRENVVNYKSNKVMIEDGWQYSKKDVSHYSLDYRLIFKCYRNFNESKFGDYDYPNGLHKDTHNDIGDIITIGKNLGFDVITNTMDFDWEPGKPVSFKCKDGAVFMEIRAYKNGNIHCKPNQEFIKQLNIEAARLNKWVKSPQEAAEELNISLAEVTKYYSTNLKLEQSNVSLLMLPQN